jgi:hypothetical protein
VDVIQLLRRVRKVFYQPPTATQRAIASLELPRWRVGTVAASGFVLVDGSVPSSSYVLRAMMTARAYATLNGLAPLVSCSSAWTIANPWIGIYRALGVRHFVGLFPGRLNPLTATLNVFRAWRLFRSVATPDDLLSLHYQGFLVGDLIYDDVLRLGRRYTIASIGCWLFPFLYKTVRTYHFYERLLDRYPVKAAVLSHTCYSTYGVPFKLMLKRGVTVHSGFRIFRSERQRPYLSDVPSSDMLRSIEQQASADLDLVDKELEDRMAPGTFTNDLGSLYAYKGKPWVTEAQLRAELRLDPRYPIVTIMAHCFSDACHYGGWMAYRDLHHWLIDTLRVINDIPGVNWVVKPHPSASLYGESQLVERMFENGALSNVKLLTSDYHAASVAAPSRALVTCIGSCGAEYAHLGVPTILAGQSTYSDCGFTYNAPTREEYYRLLRRAASLPSLSPDQQRRARVYNFFHLVMMNSLHSRLYPATDENVLGDADGRRSERMLQEMSTALQQHSPDDDLYYRRVVRAIVSGEEYAMDAPAEVVRQVRGAALAGSA